MSDGGKGSKQRPTNMAAISSNYDNIFKKDSNMQIRVKEDPKEFGKCGCGRSPTGKCIGWHGLTEEQYQTAKSEYELNEYKKQAQSIWTDSCTSERSE
jgi:hypothetical protein